MKIRRIEEKDPLVIYKCRECGAWNFTDRTRVLEIGGEKIQICVECLKELMLECAKELNAIVKVIELEC